LEEERTALELAWLVGFVCALFPFGLTFVIYMKVCLKVDGAKSFE
jgi:hypothetical protein